jgi:SAM-dependent methyltransferase
MRPSPIDFRVRAQLTELMDEPCSRDELRACLRDLAKTNRWTLGYRPVLRWLDALVRSQPPIAEPICILDVGSGYGDTLRKIEGWANQRSIPVELTGLDINPNATAIAAEASPAPSRIRWIAADVFQYAPSKPPHLVISSLFTHHLSNDDVIRFLRWMEEHATLGWCINDLYRAPIPYYFFRVASKLAELHRFVQHDGPVSIARSFVPEEWRSMCAAAGLRESDIEIRSHKPARLCVGRRKMQ